MDKKEQLEEKLKALGVQLGAKQSSSQNTTRKFGIENVINTKEEDTPFGPILVYEEQFPINYQHGSVLLSGMENFQWIARWAGLNINNAADRNKVIFLDTETSGLSRGTGTFAFLVGLGYYTKEGFFLKQIILPDPVQEPALLAVLVRHIETFDYIVTYNGKSFDLPLLAGRHRMHRIANPFTSIGHIDLLYLARKLWRYRLQSRRLGDLETHILSFTRTKDDIPGWLIPEIYQDYLHTSDARLLSGVFYHNAIDILSLAGIFVHISSILNDPTANTTQEIDRVAIGNIFEDMGSIESAKELYALCLGRELPDELFAKTIHRFASLHKRAFEWDQAVQLWQMSAEVDIDSCVELAKYFEHQTKEYETAISWTEKALGIIRKRSSPAELSAEDLELRLARLNRKRMKKEEDKNG